MSMARRDMRLAERLDGHSTKNPSPLPDSTHASASFGISSLRTSSLRTTFDSLSLLSGRALLFRAHALSLRLSASAPLCFLPAR